MKKILFLVCMFVHTFSWAQQEFVVETNKVGAEIQPNMYGIFFEDINFGADGGLYAELIKNRSFEFDQPFVGWTPFGDVQVMDENPCFDKNPHYVQMNEKGLRRGTGLENDGFVGIGYKKNNTYRFSFYARVIDGADAKFRIEFINGHNDAIGKGEVVVSSKDWDKYECVIKSRETSEKGKIRIVLETQAKVDLDHISLFPTNTWKGRKNGLRKDLVEALYNLHPGVFRFPGGCIIEGNTLDTRYQWKNSIGAVENRPINENRWNYTFKYRFYPDYYQTYGLGFYEYFLLSEDIGADPLPVVSCGLACQYESKEKVAVEDLQPYIQDALDLIEFANGSAETKWGKVRADMGHPEPFNLKMIGIGNEQWGEDYVTRLKLFMDAIHKQYPEVKIVGSSGPAPDGKDFDYLWPEMKKLDVDLVDEHYYRSPEWFLQNANRYDNYDRKGPKVFAGEYACHHKSRDNNALSAICEAAFMTGLERNADVVHLATYAPLFAHVDAWQWKPDMIWFNNLSTVCTPNYYVQQMYAHNKGTNVLPITQAGKVIAGENKLYATACVDRNKSEIIIKVVNAGTDSQSVNLNLKGLKTSAKEAHVTYLQSNDPEAVNTLAHPNNIVPHQMTLDLNHNEIELHAEGNAFYVISVKF
ncbi:MAG: alpha-L-arabinofuranosidase C-terminal domain-containing protein [Mangrovibacterium sp.]